MDNIVFVKHKELHSWFIILIRFVTFIGVSSGKLSLVVSALLDCFNFLRSERVNNVRLAFSEIEICLEVVEVRIVVFCSKVEVFLSNLNKINLSKSLFRVVFTCNALWRHFSFGFFVRKENF